MAGSLVRRGGELAVDAELVERLGRYVQSGRGAKNTLRAYERDWQKFAAWCLDHDRPALPATPETVALYLVACDHRARSTLDRYLSSISVVHRQAGHDSPVRTEGVRLARRGIRRELGVQQRRAAPATTDVLVRMLATLDVGLRADRDRALLLVGFAAALRRSELVALDVADVVPTLEGLEVHVRRSKTDQEGEGAVRAVPYGSNPATCPVRAWRRWLRESRIADGAAFRPVDRHGNLGPGRLSDRAVSLVVKERAELAGLDPAIFSGHSLRAGLATEGGRRGLPERDIARQTGHKSVTTLRSYIRDGDRWRDNVAGKVGL